MTAHGFIAAPHYCHVKSFRAFHRAFLPCILAVAMTACSLHVIDVQQGTIITPEMTGQLKPGMTRNEVLDAMGTPTISDPFHHDRWDYVYTLKEPGESLARRHIALFFDDETLVRIEDSAAGGD